MMKKLIYPQDIYDLNKNKTENPFSAPMHKNPITSGQEPHTLSKHAIDLQCMDKLTKWVILRAGLPSTNG